VNAIVIAANRAHDLLDKARCADFLAPLLLRLYLFPVFFMAGVNKLDGLLPHPNTVAWFANPEWGLGLPFPWLMALLAAYTELLGSIALFFGLVLRWFTIPLMAVMLFAAATVHISNGWFAIADPTICILNCDNVEAAAERLRKVRSILREHGNWSWLTDNGRYSYVVLNNGIEFAATYFLMLLALFFTGAGRWVSADYWIARRFRVSPGAG
jgi:uncharacterized membrane protein YphA (DoxX/SURF4 family)